MEVTRHTTATVYVVCGEKTALHSHKRHSIRLPPGGHVEQDELPFEARLRETREETGLNVAIVSEPVGEESETVEPIPRPEAIQLVDINVYNGAVGHQHIDHIYYAEATDTNIRPQSDEVTASEWEWYSIDELQTGTFESNVAGHGIEAIRKVSDC